MNFFARILGGVFGAALLASAAHAAVIVQTGGGNFAGDDNVISNACSNGISGPALTVVGCFNGNHAQNVFFKAEELIIFDGGQAVIKSADGNGFTELTINLNLNQTFSTLILNIDADTDGSVTFDFNPAGGGPQTFSLNDNGSNFFRISGEDFNFVHFTTTSGIQIALDDIVSDVAQVRIGGVKTTTTTITAVPEPATAALLASSLVGLGFARRRKRGA